MANEYLDIPAHVEVEIPTTTRLLSLIPTDTEESAKEMLEKVYVACGLNAEKETVTFPCKPPLDIATSINTNNDGLRIVVFGLSPKQIGALWAVSSYQWVKVGQRHWCFAERLEDIAADQNKKKQLWACLKILKAS